MVIAENHDLKLAIVVDGQIIESELSWNDLKRRMSQLDGLTVDEIRTKYGLHIKAGSDDMIFAAA